MGAAGAQVTACACHEAAVHLDAVAGFFTAELPRVDHDATSCEIYISCETEDRARQVALTWAKDEHMADVAVEADGSRWVVYGSVVDIRARRCAAVHAIWEMRDRKHEEAEIMQCHRDSLFAGDE